MRQPPNDVQSKHTNGYLVARKSALIRGGVPSVHIPSTRPSKAGCVARLSLHGSAKLLQSARELQLPPGSYITYTTTLVTQGDRVTTHWATFHCGINANNQVYNAILCLLMFTTLFSSLGLHSASIRCLPNHPHPIYRPASLPGTCLYLLLRRAVLCSSLRMLHLGVANLGLVPLAC